MDLLVRTSLLRTEKTAAAFTSFPVSLVGAVLRRSSAMLAIPLKKAFCLEKREKGVEKIATEGPEAEKKKRQRKVRKERKRRKVEKRKKKRKKNGGGGNVREPVWTKMGADK